MRRGPLLAIPAASLLALGCADERAAGNSIETENSVAARTMRIDSLIDPATASSWKTYVATLRLNRGNFPFARSTADGRDLRLESTRGDTLPFRIVFWDSSAEVGRLQVRLDSGILASRAGIVLRWGAGRDRTRSDSAATWRGFTAAQTAHLTTTLLDDFEDGDDTSSLSGGNTWRSGLSTNASLSVSVESSGHGRSGKALRARFTAPDPSYVLVGVPFGSGHHVFRSLDSIVFQVRGTGTFAVALEHLDGWIGPKTWKHFALDTAWRRVSIRPTDFEAPDSVGHNYGWDRVKDSVTDITFFGRDGSEFQIDNILLHGIVPGDLE